MKKLLLLLIITGQTTFGSNRFAIDKGVVGSLALGGTGMSVALYQVYSNFIQSQFPIKLESLLNEAKALENNQTDDLKKNIYKAGKRIGVISMSEEVFIAFLNNFERRINFRKNLRERITAAQESNSQLSYTMPTFIGSQCLLLFTYGCCRYSLKN